jgi:glucuronosyltransferase
VKLTRYQEAVDVRSDLLKDNMNTGLEKAVFWTEYVLKHGGKDLRPSINDLYWWQSNLLDVILVISLPMTLALYLSVTCCRKICCSKRPTEEKKGSTTKSKKTN